MINPKTGKTVIANTVPGIGHPLKLKPNIKSGIAKGARQLLQYEKATGTNGGVVYYYPKKN